MALPSYNTSPRACKTSWCFSLVFFYYFNYGTGGIAAWKELSAKTYIKLIKSISSGELPELLSRSWTYKAQSMLPLDTAAGSHCNLLELQELITLS